LVRPAGPAAAGGRLYTVRASVRGRAEA